MIREDATPDDLIDVVVKNRVYLPCLYVYNKIDQVSLEEVDRLAKQPHSVVVSCNMRLNLDYFKEMVWQYLNLIIVYTKKPGSKYIISYTFDPKQIIEPPKILPILMMVLFFEREPISNMFATRSIDLYPVYSNTL